MEEEKKNNDSVMIDTSTVQGGSPTLGKHKSKVLSSEEVKKSHCSHGPNGKCVNCLGVTKENIKEIKHQCLHPPN
jgi:hypothetical protein